MEKNDYSKYILPVGIIAVGALILYKFGSGLFGSGTGTGTNNNAVDTSSTSSITTSQQQAAAAGIPQTLTDAQCSAIANTVFTLGIAGSPTLGDDAAYQVQWQLMQVNTITDLLKVFQYFGTRKVNNGSFISLCALLNISCDNVDMQSFVNAVLPQYYRSQVNSYYSAQNINYQF